MPLPALVGLGLSLLPKLPEIWSEVAKLFGKEPPKGVEQAKKLADEVTNLFQQGKVPPEVQVKLQELMYQHAERIYELEIQDRQGARRREIEVVKATGTKDVFLYFLAMLVVAGFFALCALLMYKPLPQGSTQAVFLLFGALATGFGSVLNYFFGSSKSSKEKTELLAKK
ncbi:MAG: hypothetical protein JRH08_00810 [Deltaproteobacteria bacterium]|nr:hypothetical protein [Deltaproteobacteria bacterium]MBW2025703.1 hypothetical protein [Deltaproteobacteria bacterium]MBW2124244.1 hypothetical protein [Deltaproteobacteria bacterium]